MTIDDQVNMSEDEESSQDQEIELNRTVIETVLDKTFLHENWI